MALDHVLFLGEDIIKIKMVPTALAHLVASGHSCRSKPLAPIDNVFIQLVGELGMRIDQVYMFMLIALEVKQKPPSIANVNVLPFSASNRSLIPESEIEAASRRVLNVVHGRDQVDAVELLRIVEHNFGKISASKLQQAWGNVERADGPIVGFATGQLAREAPNHWHSNAPFAQHTFLANPRFIQ